MIDLRVRMFIEWPQPDGVGGLSFLRYFACPLEQALFLVRHGMRSWSICA